MKYVLTLFLTAAVCTLFGSDFELLFERYEEAILDLSHPIQNEYQEWKECCASNKTERELQLAYNEFMQHLTRLQERVSAFEREYPESTHILLETHLKAPEEIVMSPSVKDRFIALCLIPRYVKLLLTPDEIEEALDGHEEWLCWIDIEQELFEILLDAVEETMPELMRLVSAFDCEKDQRTIDLLAQDRFPDNLEEVAFFNLGRRLDLATERIILTFLGKIQMPCQYGGPNCLDQKLKS